MPAAFNDSRVDASAPGGVVSIIWYISSRMRARRSSGIGPNVSAQTSSVSLTKSATRARSRPVSPASVGAMPSSVGGGRELPQFRLDVPKRMRQQHVAGDDEAAAEQAHQQARQSSRSARCVSPLADCQAITVSNTVSVTVRSVESSTSSR